MIERAGAALVAIGLVVGDGAIVLLGAVLLAAALLHWLHGRAFDRLVVAVGARPGRVALGHDAALVVTVENPTRLPIGPLVVELELPTGALLPGVASRPAPAVGRSFVALEFRIGRRERIERTYPLLVPQRGRHRIGPVALVGTDPLALRERRSEHAIATELAVLPRPATTGMPPLGIEWRMRGAPRALALAEERDRVAGTRPFRLGARARVAVRRWRSCASAARNGVSRSCSTCRRVSALGSGRTRRLPSV